MCCNTSPEKPWVHQVKGRLSEWGFPAKGLKPFPVNRKHSKDHVPSPGSQLNPPWEDSPDLSGRELSQQMFNSRGWR